MLCCLLPPYLETAWQLSEFTPHMEDYTQLRSCCSEQMLCAPTSYLQTLRTAKDHRCPWAQPLLTAGLSVGCPHLPRPSSTKLPNTQSKGKHQGSACLQHLYLLALRNTPLASLLTLANSENLVPETNPTVCSLQASGSPASSPPKVSCAAG